MIIHGDSLRELKLLADDSIDFVCTDPPYGYSFMGKDWDKAVPSTEIWKECVRVLKPGAFCCVMSAPRSDVQNAMISRLIEAGFRLDFTPIYWTYASGFPKAGNIGKMVDKRLGQQRDSSEYQKQRGSAFGRTSMAGGLANPNYIYTQATSDEAKALDGSYAGFQPKPAVEVILVAMKPLSEKTYVDQALANGKGVSWLDDCRVPTDDVIPDTSNQNIKNNAYTADNGDRERDTTYSQHSAGRFPANLLVSNHALNDHSKYFDLDKWAESLPFLAVPKASKSEKNKGLEHLPKRAATSANKIGGEGSDFRTGSGNERDIYNHNHHPTVKPLKLMSYLITLFSRAGDTVLDPFCGSGTTCVAAKELRRIPLGIEREVEYVLIARTRLDADKQERLI